MMVMLNINRLSSVRFEDFMYEKATIQEKITLTVHKNRSYSTLKETGAWCTPSPCEDNALISQFNFRDRECC